jgi:ESCRT-II complex subunit VPS22
MKEQLTLFKNKLEEFAHKHKADIRKDPVFRAQFHVMCANIGVDPLASNKVGDYNMKYLPCFSVENIWCSC